MSVADLVRAIVALHNEVADASEQRSGGASLLDGVVGQEHRRAAAALKESLVDLDDIVCGHQLQYTALRELEAEILSEQRELGETYGISMTFTGACKLFDRAATGADAERVADFLASCAKVEEAAAKRMATSQQPNMAYG